MCTAPLLWPSLSGLPATNCTLSILVGIVVILGDHCHDYPWVAWSVFLHSFQYILSKQSQYRGMRNVLTGLWYGHARTVPHDLVISLLPPPPGPREQQGSGGRQAVRAERLREGLWGACLWAWHDCCTGLAQDQVSQKFQCGEGKARPT